MTRESGYYWVKGVEGTWFIGLWDASKKQWSIAGWRFFWDDKDFKEINETQILAPNK